MAIDHSLSRKQVQCHLWLGNVHIVPGREHQHVWLDRMHMQRWLRDLGQRRHPRLHWCVPCALHARALSSGSHALCVLVATLRLLRWLL